MVFSSDPKVFVKKESDYKAEDKNSIYTIKYTPIDKKITPKILGLVIFSLKKIFPKKTELNCPTDLFIDSIIGT